MDGAYPPQGGHPPPPHPSMLPPYYSGVPTTTPTPAQPQGHPYAQGQPHGAPGHAPAHISTSHHNSHVGQPQQQHAAQQRPPGTVSIWAGDLDSYMDENFLRSAVAACGWANDITRIKVVRDRFTGAHAGYGFLDAASPEAAARVLQTGSGMPIPGSTRCWRLNMGRQGSGGLSFLSSLGGAGAETNVYVGDLDHSVTEFQLMSAFRPRYASTRHAKVVCNEFGVSRGFGFVRFGDSQEAERAVAEMQGFEFQGKPIRLSPANGRGGRGGNNSNGGGHGHQMNNSSAFAGGLHGSGGMCGTNNTTHKRPRQTMASDDPNNTTLFIGGTGAHVNEEVLMREFSAFGEIEAVRVPTNKTGFCFVRFKLREQAERAKEEMAHAHVAALNPHKAVRLEWATEQISARNQNNNNSNNNSMYAHEFVPPQQHTSYRVEPVRVPIGSHGLVMPPHGVPPQQQIGVMLGAAPVQNSNHQIASGNVNMNGGAPLMNTVSGAQNNSNNGSIPGPGTVGHDNEATNAKDEDQPPAKKANVAGLNEYSSTAAADGHNTSANAGESKRKNNTNRESSDTANKNIADTNKSAGTGSEFAWLAAAAAGTPTRNATRNQ